MPPLPVVPNVIKVITHYSVGLDTSALCRQYFSYSGGPPTAADLNALATNIRTTWATNIAPLYYNGGGLGTVICQDLASATGATGTDTTNASGTRTGSPLPRSTAMLINHVVSRRYRGGKPRSYLPLGAAADIVAGGGWNSTFTNTCSTNYAAWIAAIVGYTHGSTTIAAHVNVSYYSGFTVVTNPTTGRAKNVSKLRGTPLVDTITSSIANGVPANQRRRNRYT